MEAWYGQGGGVDDCVKVESVFNVKEDKRVSAKSEPAEDTAEHEDYGHYRYNDDYEYELEEDKKVKVNNKLDEDNEDDLYKPGIKLSKNKGKGKSQKPHTQL